MAFTHLHVHSNFSFLQAGSSVEALVDRAREVGCTSLAVTDKDGLYGAVRFYRYAREAGIKPIIGAEITIENGSHLVLLARNLDGYSNLCRIITHAHLSHEAGEASVDMEALSRFKDGLFCLSGCMSGEVPYLLLQGKHQAASEAAGRYAEIFGKERYFLEMQNHLLPGNSLLNAKIHALAGEMGLHTVATGNVHYARKEDFRVQDVLTCVRTLTRIGARHPERKANCEYYLKSPRAMAGLFAAYPEAVAASSEIAEECNLDLSLGTYRFPRFDVPEGETAYSYLCRLCFDGLTRLYRPISPEVVKRLQYELSVIDGMGFSEYFLVVWDIVRHARKMGIRCSGRGSAADSLVAYCLGITIADPIEHDLLFERFLNPGRKGMPDIDIDFDSERRDEVIDYIYKRHGEDKVAMVCTVSTLSARSAVRDIGKAMDVPQEEIDRLASSLPHTSAKRIRESVERLPELRDGGLPIHKMETLVDLCEKVDGFPRHLSVHLGGLVVSGEPLTDLVPLERAAKGVVVSQYDKDDVEALGLVKIDILGLKNLSAIEEALKTIRDTRGVDVDIDNIPAGDPKTYDLLRSTDTVGLFQLESPGMRGLLGRLQPERFEDIIAQLALFRPGPMQADMINPYIARRHGREQVTFIHPALEPALRETYGVILYQEQVLRAAHAVAGFTMGQADSLRRAMTKNRTQEEMEKIKAGFMDGAAKSGIDADVAEEIFGRLRAFAAYGFCKAHAASFARIAYQAAYLKAHYPAEFFAGILSCEPMGFYPGNVILEEARRMGVGILGVNINRSRKRFTVEGGKIRIGLMQVKGISDAEIASILKAREEGVFASLSDFCSRTRVSRPAVENLICCGAFGSSRRRLLWQLGGVMGDARKQKKEDPPCERRLIEPCCLGESTMLPNIPEPPLHVMVRMDYDILGMSHICHPMAFYRKTLRRMGVAEARSLRDMQDKSQVVVSGVVVTCMRPPTKSGVIVVFITLEDETGLADVVVFPKVYDRYGRVIYGSSGLIIEGQMERSGKGLSIITEKISPLTARYRNGGLVPDDTPYTERTRSVGHRSWVKGQGV